MTGDDGQKLGLLARLVLAALMAAMAAVPSQV